MMSQKRNSLALLLTAVFIFFSLNGTAQQDTTHRMPFDSFLKTRKGVIGKLAKSMVRDTFHVDDMDFVRNDAPFVMYKDRIIRHIYIRSLEFGRPINEFATETKTKLKGIKKIANSLHTNTREFAIRENLFFKENDSVAPYLLGDNVRYLRDLPYVQDARIRIIPVFDTDSVDVMVITKDVFSIGGSFRMKNSESILVSTREDNFLGWGDRFQIQGLVDIGRREKFGYGAEYVERNIGGSFIEGAVGFLNFNRTISSGRREGEIAYLRLSRPMANRFLKWTYGLDLETHHTNNFYNSDSLYNADFKYKYYVADAWGGWNMDAGFGKEDDRKRRLVGLRVVKQRFSEVPDKYASEYFYKYADLQAVLGSFSFFRQDFYKTKFIYGFGRAEDVPEGTDVSFTAGWTKKQDRERPFAGINYQRYFFTSQAQYFHFTLAGGAFYHQKKFEDIDLVGSIDYFSSLLDLSSAWKQRFFLGISATRQINHWLSEPLRIESQYGLPDFRNNQRAGDTRLMAKAESVFYSPWSLLLFRFAPFIFGNATYFNLTDSLLKDQSKLFSSVGAGVRVRNESLIFGTTEFRATFFPRKNFSNDNWKFEVSTNIRFKYNENFIRRPDFVRVN